MNRGYLIWIGHSVTAADDGTDIPNLHDVIPDLTIPIGLYDSAIAHTKRSRKDVIEDNRQAPSSHAWKSTSKLEKLKTRAMNIANVSSRVLRMVNPVAEVLEGVSST